MLSSKNDIFLRWKIQTRNRSYCEILPEGYKNWQMWISPVKGFGSGYVTIATNSSAFQLVVSEDGLYNVLGIAERDIISAKSKDGDEEESEAPHKTKHTERKEGATSPPAAAPGNL